MQSTILSQMAAALASDIFPLCVLIQVLPESLGSLTRLKVLAADQNRIAAVPPAIFKGCTSLHTLTLHENPITIEVLPRSSLPYRYTTSCPFMICKQHGNFVRHAFHVLNAGDAHSAAFSCLVMSKS